MINRAGLGIACAVAATLFYGLVPNFVRGALLNGIPALETIAFRTAFIAAVLALVAGLRRESFRLPSAARPAFTLQSLATLTVSVGYLASVQFIPVGLAAIIFYTFPVMILLAAPLVEGHAPGAKHLLVALAAFAGLAIAVGPTFESLDVRGIALALMAAVGCAVQFFSGRALAHHMTPAAFGSLVHVAVLPVTLALALWGGNGTLHAANLSAASPVGLGFMLAVGAAYVGGYLSHMFSLRFAPASMVAPYYNLEPVIATAVAALMLGERLNGNQYVGGGMVLAALVASSWAGSKKDAAS
jgi:drug/metabolite transporter (DMT)-like permease